jgi:hypothetical protein
MALIRRLEKTLAQRDNVHQETSCHYKVFSDHNGTKYLQIDTFGSASRKIKGKTSQTMQFGPEAIEQLRDILDQEHL